MAYWSYTLHMHRDKMHGGEGAWVTNLIAKFDLIVFPLFPPPNGETSTSSSLNLLAAKQASP